MKAAFIDRYGSNDRVSVADIALPLMGPLDLLVQVHAASVNPLDVKTRDGKLKMLLKYRFPLVLGNDLSGVVSDVGAQVTRFKKGDAVYARLDKDRIGTFAEFAVVSEGAAALKPTNVTFEEAASFPLVALTAWQALVEIGKLGAHQRVLIHAGSGGVGSVAIQPGGVVVSIGSTPSAGFARSLGFNPIIVLAISMMSRKATAAARGHHARYEYLFVRADGEQLREITRLVESGAIKPLIDKVFPLEHVRDALAYSESGRATGKVVIKVA